MLTDVVNSRHVPCDMMVCKHNSLNGLCMCYLTRSKATRLVENSCVCPILRKYANAYLYAINKAKKVDVRSLQQKTYTEQRREKREKHKKI